MGIIYFRTGRVVYLPEGGTVRGKRLDASRRTIIVVTGGGKRATRREVVVEKLPTQLVYPPCKQDCATCRNERKCAEEP